MSATVFALLDDRSPGAAHRSSRLYEGFVREHRCVAASQLDALCADIEADQRAGLHALLLADYEWGAKLLGAGTGGFADEAQRALRERQLNRSALRVLMFERCSLLSRSEADEWLAAQEDGAQTPSAAGVIGLEASVSRAQFDDAIVRIHAAIRAGETYQVNYTYRLHGHAFGAPVALYRRLRERQPVAFGAFIALPPRDDDADAPTHVLSCSPELFLRHRAGLVTARPMKGTAPRVAAPESDSETARLLAIDDKNRAENLMIVDLLRNDLGRLARIGSVRVPSLFAIEPYRTVFQMTSTVEAELRPEVGLPELLRATFPCGSITGAPKHHTMQLIAGFESTARGLYCGAIGWLDAAPFGTPSAGASRLGDFCFSVAIRTLVLGADDGRGLRPATLGIGAGIVQDSRAADEWDECRLKARFLTGVDPGFELFETMRAEAGEVALWPQHLARLAASAAALGFSFDAPAAPWLVEERLQKLDAAGPTRLRLALRHDGALDLRDAPLAPLQAMQDGAVGLLLAGEPLPDARPLAGHKTTLRAAYDAGVRTAEAAGAFDTLFFDQRGQLAEGGRSSVFVQIDGDWFTPPLAAGVLPGVQRAQLLADLAWGAAEREITRAELLAADAIVICNALRGVLRARLLG